ncbi:aminotransferase class I/II-fold pyridoxal phosphate-dependent enzyme [Aestuariivivens insulae]|uniref:aminotransferase class I/II-fold pyridoxal phosphate-dependent enzyme n=1 Tax=Aestuariivivens insulae TaxID=1621988 RepID=UPI001F576A83|nr:8-amino-7-oxononanoate synthase [Aestuariivivens insulae]
MDKFPKNLQHKLDERKVANALRQLNKPSGLVDFSSNDYLGLAKSKDLFEQTHNYLIHHNIAQNGATGSRLLSGNHPLYSVLEAAFCEFHKSEAALVFNSGYDANVGLFSSVPQRGDIILYDEYIHASIRDGIKLSNAQAYKFKHNDLDDLGRHLKRRREVLKDHTIYVATESVFSMDGDTPNLIKLVELCKAYGAFVIVDEAHAVGVFGANGCGIVQELGLEQDVFARLITFGKALGCHGAVILGSEDLKQYLVNFSRSFIYTTALPPHSLATIQMAYNMLVNLGKKGGAQVQKLHQNIAFFKAEINRLQFNLFPLGRVPQGQLGFIESHSAIHCCVVSGNDTVKLIAAKLQEHGFDVKPILSPTVPKGEERLRFCLHAFNSEQEISEVLKVLATFVA